MIENVKIGVKRGSGELFMYNYTHPEKREHREVEADLMVALTDHFETKNIAEKTYRIGDNIYRMSVERVESDDDT